MNAISSDTARVEWVRDEVRRHYARAAEDGNCCSTGGCGDRASATEVSTLGYSADEIAALPPGADLGLGCGNPQAIAALKPGEIVLDLGSGAGFDCFLAARAVGSTGRVIGVDMTPEMLSRAWANAAKSGMTQLDFRFGHIEALPVAENSVDVVISNCVINLSPTSRRCFVKLSECSSRAAGLRLPTLSARPISRRRSRPIWPPSADASPARPG